MNITLISGHKKNWGAGASSVYLHLDRELQQLGCHSHLFNLEDYMSDRLPSALHKLTQAFSVEQRMLPQIEAADVV